MASYDDDRGWQDREPNREWDRNRRPERGILGERNERREGRTQEQNLHDDDSQRGYSSGSDYWGRESGGGMGTYQSGERSGSERRSSDWDRGERSRRGEYAPGSEGWRESRQQDRGYGGPWDDRYRSRREERNDWGDQRFSGREGGWGGYGSYDRERGFMTRPRERSGYPGRESSWRGEPVSSGQFSGRGPKGYTRSDERICEDINERLMEHPDIDASDIEVEVMGAEVTLRGAVNDRQTKHLAEDVAERVFGVRDVHNQIRVNRGFWDSVKHAFTGEPDDAEERHRSRQPERSTGETVSTLPGVIGGTESPNLKR